MSGDSARIDKPFDAHTWFIAIGVVVALVGGWFAMGQPGRPLQDGTYTCSTGAGPLELKGLAPAATVKNGEVVDAWDFDMRKGTKTSVPFSDVERKGPKEFRFTSVILGPRPGSNLGQQSYICTDD